MLEHFNIDATRTEDTYSLACPIHQGDNPNGLTIFSREKNGYVGNWKCWTHNCEQTYGSSIIGFIRALKKIPYHDAKRWVVEFLNIKEVQETVSVCEREFIKLSNILNPPRPLVKNSQGRMRLKVC